MHTTSCTLLVVILAAHIAAEDAPAEKFDFDFADRPLKAALALINAKSGVELYTSRKEDDDIVVKASLKNRTWREALDAVAKAHGLRVESNPDWGKLMFLSPDPLVTIHADNAAIPEILLDAATQANQNIAINDDVQGKLSVNWDKKPWSEALAELLKASGAVAATGPCNTIQVMGAKSLERMKEARRVKAAYVGGNKKKDAAGLRTLVGGTFHDNALYVGEGAIIKALRKLSGYNIYMPGPKDPALETKRKKLVFQKFSMDCKDVTCLGALEIIARRNGLSVDISVMENSVALRMEAPAGVSLAMKGADIRDVINLIAINNPMNIVIGDEVQCGPAGVWLRFEKVPPEAAFSAFIEPLGMTVVDDPGEIWRINSAEILAQQVTEEGHRAGSIGMEFLHGDLSDIIATIRIQSGAKIVFDPDAIKDRRVSCRLDAMHWKLGLESILRSQGLSLQQQDDGSYHVIPPRKE